MKFYCGTLSRCKLERPQSGMPKRKSHASNRKNIFSRWSVARAFSPGRFLNLILAHRGEVDNLNKARHWNVLIGGNFSSYFYHCKGIFDFS